MAMVPRAEKGIFNADLRGSFKKDNAFELLYIHV
jgi:hypothetical protein